MKDNDRTDFFCYLAFSICFSLVLVAVYLLGKTPIRPGDLADSDCYMHLIRAADLYETGQWYDPVIMRSNAPYGDRLHWTRPFDLLLLAGAIPVNLMMDFDAALFWWGVVISPILMMAVLLAMRWASRPLLGPDGTTIVGFLLVVQFTVLAYMQAGRPDHHGWLLLLFVLSLGVGLRLVRHPFAPGLCVAAGAVGALSMWASVESLVFVAVMLGTLGGLWIRYGDDSIKKALCYSASLFAGTSLSLVIERPWRHLLAVEFDRLSVVYGVIFALMTLLLLALPPLATRLGLRKKPLGRLLASLAAATLLVCGMVAIFPRSYGGPLADIGPGMSRVLAQIQELQPLLSREQFLTSGAPLIGYATVFLLLLCSRRIDLKNPHWMLVSVAIVAFAGLSFHQVRWAMYGQALLVLPAAAFITHLRSKVSDSQRGLRRDLANVGITGAFILLATFGTVITHFTKGDESPACCPRPSLRPICRYLTTSAECRGRKLRILTEVNYGAEILYRTPHEVIATLYHRNWQAIADACAIMAAPTAEEAQSRIYSREIDMILLSPGVSAWSRFAQQSGETSTFYQYLCQKGTPPWCREIVLPDDLASFRLFEVKYGGVK